MTLGVLEPRELIAGFERLAAIHPDRAAIRAQERSISYGELDELSSGTAQQLIQAGSTPGCVVGIAAESRAAHVVAVLGTLKAGGTCLPLDPGAPAKRANRALASVGAWGVISDISENRAQPHPGVSVTYSERSTTSPGVHLPTGGPAFIFSSSGTTGQPKSIAIGSEAIVNLAKAASSYGVGREPTVLFGSSTAFDASLFEIFCPLLSGGTVVPMDVRKIVRPADFQRFVGATKVDTAFFTTALFNAMARSRQAIFQLFEVALFGGERANPECVAWVLNNDRPRRSLMHVYGPTECTTFSTAWAVQDFDGAPPIGRAIRGLTARVVGSRLDEPGATGELAISGSGVGLGYVGDPRLTADKFRPARTGLPGSREYFTGDNVRFRSDKEFEFLARKDRQLKYRGFRVELGEIEHEAVRLTEVDDAVAVAKVENGACVGIGLMVRTRAAVTAEQVRECLRETLPKQMLPQQIVATESHLPRNLNGKLDRAVIRETLFPSSAGKNLTDEPLLALTRTILACGEVTSLDRGFVNLGGDSISAIVLATKAADLGRIVDPFDLLATESTSQYLAECSHGPTPQAASPILESAEVLLTPFQRRMLHDSLLGPRDLYAEAVVYVSEGHIEDDELRQALEHLVGRHHALRARLDWNSNSDPIFHYAGECTSPIEFRAEQRAKSAAAAVDAILDVRSDGFDLDGPLARIVVERASDMEVAVGLVIHHLIADGWSTRVFFHELNLLLAGASLAPPPELDTLNRFAQWANESFQRDSEEAPPVSDAGPLACTFDPPAVFDGDRGTWTRTSSRLAPGEWSALVESARLMGVTPNAVICSVLIAKQASLRGERDAAIAVSLLERPRSIQAISRAMLCALATAPLVLRDIPSQWDARTASIVQDGLLQLQRLASDRSSKPQLDAEIIAGGSRLPDTLFVAEVGSRHLVSASVHSPSGSQRLRAIETLSHTSFPCVVVVEEDVGGLTVSSTRAGLFDDESPSRYLDATMLAEALRAVATRSEEL